VRRDVQRRIRNHRGEGRYWGVILIQLGGVEVWRPGMRLCKRLFGDRTIQLNQHQNKCSDRDKTYQTVYLMEYGNSFDLTIFR
jgi:hypothetical protein